MRNFTICRRTFICTIGIIVLGVLGYLKGMDVAGPIAFIAIGIAGANAYEKAASGNTRYKDG